MAEPQKSVPRSFSPCEACTIRHLSVCRALSPNELASLEAITTPCRIPPSQMIFGEGEPAVTLFNVVDGAVKTYKLLPDGRRQITGFLFPGDFLGIPLRDRYAYSAEAITASRLCRFPRAKFEALLAKFPGLEKELLLTASNDLAAAQDQMVLLGRKTAIERVATFLLSLAARARRRQTDQRALILPMSRAEIGDHLGLTVETVSRSFTKLRKLGVIALQGSHAVEIVRPDTLSKLAGLEPDDIEALGVGTS